MVVEVFTEVPVAGARVSVGDIVTSTDAAGRFSLAVPPGTRVPVDVRPPAGQPLSSTQLLIDVTSGAVVHARAALLRGCSAVINVSVASGEIPTAPCGDNGVVAGLSLPAGGVVDENGAPVAQVAVEMIAMPIVLGGREVADAFIAFPGDMGAVDGDGNEVFLQSRGAVEVRLTDATTGRPAQLAPGVRATVTFPASGDAIDDDVVPAWFYDEETAQWREEGVTTLDVDVNTGALVHRLEVAHFTWWNADQVATRTCLTGTVVDADGAPLRGAFLNVRGVDHRASTNGATDDAGRFSVFARRSSEVVLEATVFVGNAVVSAAQVVRTGPDATCVDVGAFVLDTDAAFGCVRGVAVDEAGAPIPDATLTALTATSTRVSSTAADGSFCVPVLPGLVNVALRGEVAGVPVRADVDLIEALPANGACGGSECADLGQVVLLPEGCVRGVVAGATNPVPGAIVRASAPHGVTHEVSSDDGSFCVSVPQAELVDVDVTLRGSFFESRAVLEDAFTLQAGNCGEPSTCFDVGAIVMGNAACLRGVALDEATGTPLGGVVVDSVVRATGRILRTFTNDDGSFCAPALAGLTTDVHLRRVVPGTEHFATLTVTPPETPASCSAGNDCVDLGEIRLVARSVQGCIVGQLADAGQPFRDDALVLFDGTPIAAIRPREDGRFCLELALVDGIQLQDRVGEDGSCVVDRTTTRIPVSLVDGACADPTTCTDIGVVDFADFCSGS